MQYDGVYYTQVYRTLLTSSVWCNPHPHTVRIVWMTLLLLADRRGVVRASVPGLATAARVTIEEAEEALIVFRSPDRYSRTKAEDGVRIVDVEGGWLLLNYERHHQSITKEADKASKRAWHHRNKGKGSSDLPATSSGPFESADPGVSLLVDQKLEEDEKSPSISISTLSDSDLDPDQTRGDTHLPERTFAPSSWERSEPPGQALKVAYKSLEGWTVPPEVYIRALEIGLGRATVDQRIDELRNKPIGGKDGVFDRTRFVLRLLPKWKIWAETGPSGSVHRAGEPSAPRGTVDTPPRSERFLEPTAKHRAYAREFGLDLEAITKDLIDKGRVDGLGNKDALELLGKVMSAEVRKRKGAA